MATIRKLAKFLKPYWLSSVLAPLMMLLEVMMDLLQPRMIQRIVDEGIAQLNLSIVFQTGGWMIGFAFLGMLGGVGCTIFATLASQGFGADLRAALFRKVQSLSFGNLDELETGRLITNLTNDITQVQEMVAMLLRVMVRAPLLLVGSLAMAIATSPRLASMLVVLGPLVAVLVFWIVRKAYPLFWVVQEKLDGLNTVLQENLAGVRVVKAFVRASHEISRFGKVNDELMNQTVKAARTMAVTWPGMMTILNAGVVAAIWFGGIQITVGGMQTGQLIAFVNYLTQTLFSLMMVSMLVMRLARAQASADRIQEVFDSETKIKNPDAPIAVEGLKGWVTFDDVTFGYGNGQAPVLRNVSFSAQPGQTVALLGATGSGKSSLIHLIPRFYEVSAGKVTIDGIDVRNLDEQVLRDSVSIALQESVLFTGTIRDNIRYGRPEASESEVIAAAKAAQAHEFIMRFPEGYDSQVGQRGVNLSGGQKQRIAIARALLKKPSVLILDDSTSSVDVETEAAIETALETWMEGRTSFVIAQRISTVLNADKILVLDEGQIAAEGTHADLIAGSPIYREIYESQLGNGVVTHD